MISQKTDFTQGSILKKLFWFMLPVLGALILQAAYGAVDLLIVGRFGSTSGLSAVSTGSQVLNLVTFAIWEKKRKNRSVLFLAVLQLSFPLFPLDFAFFW